MDWDLDKLPVTDSNCDKLIVDRSWLHAWRDRIERVEAENERLSTAIVAHRERWTSVNSGDIKRYARPADLELWEVLDSWPT